MGHKRRNHSPPLARHNGEEAIQNPEDSLRKVNFTSKTIGFMAFFRHQPLGGFARLPAEEIPTAEETSRARHVSKCLSRGHKGSRG